MRIRDLASGQDRELVKASAFSQLLAPSISPDGATVLFSGASSTPPGGAPRASGPLERLAALFEPTAALAHGFPYEIWTVPSAGGTARPLTRIAEDNPIARYSADGRSVLVFGGGGLYLVDAASGMTRFVHSIGAHGGMDWRSRG